MKLQSEDAEVVSDNDLFSWQTGKPTESGWYWVEYPGYARQIQRINFSADGDFQVQRIKRWAGPIPEPR